MDIEDEQVEQQQCTHADHKTDEGAEEDLQCGGMEVGPDDL
jgi:hypothetical protein